MIKLKHLLFLAGLLALIAIATSSLAALTCPQERVHSLS